MSRIPLALATLSVAGSALLAAPTATAATAAPAGTYVVVLRDGVAPDAAAAAVAARGAEIRAIYRYALHGYAADLTDELRAALLADPAVASVTANARLHVDTTQPGAPWGLDRIDQRTGTNGSYTYTATGSGVTAYIIDTGIRTTHVDFGGRALSGFDAVDGGAADDCHGHGTHVAGTVGGTTYGVAKAVRLVAVRVLDCAGNGDIVDVVEGIDWVTEDHLLNPTRPSVANMSIGSDIPLPPIDAAVSGSIASGVTYSVAAGNNGAEAGACISSPGRVAEAMTIGATASNDVAASFSNYGPCVDWYAPGVSVLSAYNSSNTATATMSGTSMATPHNTGVAAQYLQNNPLSTPAQVTVALMTRLTQRVVTTPDEFDRTFTCGVGFEAPCTAFDTARDAVLNDDLLYSGF